MWQYTQRFLFSLVLSFFFFSSPFFFFVCCFFSRCNCWNWQYSIWLIGHVFLLFFFVLCWESPTSIDVRKSLRLESENWRQNCFFFCALFSAFFLLLTLICIIYRVLTDRWALLLMVLRIFVKTHKQTGAHSNTKKKKKTMIRLRTFGCRNCVFTQYRHVNNNEKKVAFFLPFFPFSFCWTSIDTALLCP